ncbi:hypothetical protein GZH47_21965 [Paenibacillus rhizovicinus]|uniref:Uncharacterized protein n=1 Tax=Paenibacillus rhizovicinus TaxID=2704463 RepID=A0A6C0P4K1_9BACL|nr:hypothetical protein [Paenibacillus rhizovicinus]QHW33186.1 hypothetical protein GZH47_21965 [Paenibacillus rhizovicinus]
MEERMKKYAHLAIILVLVAVSLIAVQNKGKSISSEEAERFALSQAAKDGYQEAKIWNRFNRVTSAGDAYSPTREKFVKVWQVALDAAGHPAILNTPAVIYNVDRKDGSIVSSVKGLLQAGMDLRISDLELNDPGHPERGLKVTIRNEGKKSYVIEWIQPCITASDQPIPQDEVPIITVNKPIPINGEVVITDTITFKGDQPSSRLQDTQGYFMKAQEEEQPALILVKPDR